MDESKFTPTAEEALQLAQEAAGELGHGYMGTEHLLLGLMREDEGLAHTVLAEAGLTDDLLTEMVCETAGSRPSDTSGSAQNLSPRAKHMLEMPWRTPSGAAMPTLAPSICWPASFARATIWQSGFCGLPVWMPVSCTRR
mgnify:CR=1 FL=1